MIEQIPDPVNYLTGLPKPDFYLPENIVMFCRHSDKLRHAPMSNPFQYVLIINHRGEGDILLNEHRLHLFSKQAVLIFPGQVHYYDNLKVPLTWLYITFKITSSESFAVLRNSKTPMSPMAWHYVRQLVGDYLNPTHAMPTITSRIIFNFWLLLMELANCNPRRIPTRTHLEQATYARIQQIQQYVLTNIHEPLHIADVARHVHMSPSRLGAFVRQTTRHGLGRYIRHTRIVCACELMNASELTLSEIAERGGFGSIYAFSRAFKQVMKVSPSAYRARLKKALIYPHRRLPA